jgi:zinc transporter, ZIP family
MSHLTIILLASWLAGIASFVGGLIARFEHTAESETKSEYIHGIVAFGGGILVAAVAFALAPQGIAVLDPVTLGTAFCAGGIVFAVLDAHMTKRGGTKAQLMAMLMDFVPEAISLGAVFEDNRRLGLLLAAFIGAQNLPEGFNAYREIVAAGMQPRTALRILFAASLLGPLAAWSGHYFLQGHADWTAIIMIFASGGILYLIFQDIAPQSKMQRHWAPPLGAVFGFVVGLIGTKLIG